MYTCIKYCGAITVTSDGMMRPYGWDWYDPMCVTYISWGLNLWIRAQRAMPLFQDDVKSVIITFL